jgi:hypothetical protein
MARHSNAWGRAAVCLFPLVALAGCPIYPDDDTSEVPGGDPDGCGDPPPWGGTGGGSQGGGQGGKGQGGWGQGGWGQSGRAGTGGFAGTGGGSSAGAGGGGSTMTCEQKYDACASDEKCAKMLECVLLCARVGDPEAVVKCIADTGASLALVAPLAACQTQEQYCKSECATGVVGAGGSSGSSGASGSGGAAPTCPPAEDDYDLIEVTTCGEGPQPIACFDCFCAT